MTLQTDGDRAANAPDTENASETHVAQCIVQELGGDAVYCRGEFRRYDPTAGIWRAMAQGEIIKRCTGFDGMYAGGKRINVSWRFAKGVERLCAEKLRDDTFFDDAREGFAFRNGFVVVRPGQVVLTGHCAANKAIAALPFDYEPGATCATWTWFLSDVFEGDPDAADKIQLVQEFAGACLVGSATTYQRCLMFIGEGANGKSVLVNGLFGMFPAGSATAIPPHEWGQEYRRAEFNGIRLNAVGEIKSSEILASDSFKSIVAGDVIIGRKIHQEPFSFKPIAGHIFSANELPAALDHSEGFWRRFIVLQFNRSYLGKEDRSLGDCIAKEHAGMMAWALQGAARIAERGQYVMPASSGPAAAAWRESVDQVSVFIKCCTNPAGIPHVNASKAYTSYVDWARRAGYRHILGAGTFSKRLSKIAPKKHTEDGNVYQFAILPEPMWHYAIES